MHWRALVKALMLFQKAAQLQLGIKYGGSVRGASMRLEEACLPLGRKLFERNRQAVSTLSGRKLQPTLGFEVV
jgi:hypothetical protein